MRSMHNGVCAKSSTDMAWEEYRAKFDANKQVLRNNGAKNSSSRGAADHQAAP